eukprot:GHVH01002696.1.p1 GENE.GHVH01002696.1~~GHVH01002696.1.p1  ORF type:complete len:876 (+),score=102.06 GHVH01002696.1:391-3018(+)
MSRNITSISDQYNPNASQDDTAYDFTLMKSAAASESDPAYQETQSNAEKQGLHSHMSGCAQGRMEMAYVSGQKKRKTTRTRADEAAAIGTTLSSLERATQQEWTRLVVTGTCTDRQCNTWRDLHQWFGYNLPHLPGKEFSVFFTDAGHGGTGVFERMVVAGQEALRIAAEDHIGAYFDAQKLRSIPADLVKNLPDDTLREIWVLKRVERLLSPYSLLSFASNYLACAQSLPNQLASTRYVLACIGFSIQQSGRSKGMNTPVGSVEPLSDWMPTLVEHMYWIQSSAHRLDGITQEENELLQDLQQYYGYPYYDIVPRIREIMELRTHPIGGGYAREGLFGDGACGTTAPTGKNIVKFYATAYFTELAKQGESIVTAERRSAWVFEETKMFMESKIIDLFASLYMSLSPFFARYSLLDNSIMVSSQTYGEVLMQLVAACYVLSNEARARVWMSAFVHRLRQIQLMLHATETKKLISLVRPAGTLSPLEELGVNRSDGWDVYKWSSMSKRIQRDRFLAEWGNHHGIMAALQDYPDSEYDDMKKALADNSSKSIDVIGTNSGDDAPGLGFCAAIGKFINETTLRSRSNGSFEIKQLPEGVRPVASSGWSKRPVMSPDYPDANSREQHEIERYRKAAGEPFAAGGVELWRPPGALFMKPRVISKPQQAQNLQHMIPMADTQQQFRDEDITLDIKYRANDVANPNRNVPSPSKPIAPIDVVVEDETENYPRLIATIQHGDPAKGESIMTADYRTYELEPATPAKPWDQRDRWFVRESGRNRIIFDTAADGDTTPRITYIGPRGAQGSVQPVQQSSNHDGFHVPQPSMDSIEKTPISTPVSIRPSTRSPERRDINRRSSAQMNPSIILNRRNSVPNDIWKEF